MSVDQRHPTPTSAQANRPAVTIDIERVGNVSVVRVAGAVDMMTVPLVEFELRRAVIGDTSAVVVDLNGVSFLACCGLQMLAEIRDMARARQVCLRLAVQCRAVLRPMEITGLLDAFLVLPSVSGALAALTALRYPAMLVTNSGRRMATSSGMSPPPARRLL
jgi:anti-sigma B factor antagonist